MNDKDFGGNSLTKQLCSAGSVEMAYGTPFLLQLGLSKSLMSLVWLAGPLSGTVPLSVDVARSATQLKSLC